MSTRTGIISKFKFELSGKIISVGAGAILTILLARLLEPDGYGLLFLTISILSFAELFTKLGISHSAARYIAQYKQSKPELIKPVLTHSMLLLTVSTVLTTSVYVFSIPYISLLIDEDGLSTMLYLGTFFLLSSSLTKFFRIVFQGFENIRFSSIINVVNRVMRTILCLTLVLLGFGAGGALIGYVGAFLLSSTLGLIYMWRSHIHGLNCVAYNKEMSSKIFKYSIPLTVTTAANKIQMQFDKLLIGVFVGSAGVAYYTVAKQVTTFVQTPVEALGFTISPSFESLKVSGEVDSASKLYEEALSNSLILYIPAASGLVVISEPLILLIFGGDYFSSIILLQMLSIYLVLQVITTLTGKGLDYLGKAKARAIVKSITAIINLVLNIVLIPIYGVVAAAISTIITYSIYTIAHLILIDGEFDLNWGPIFNRTMLSIVISLIIVLITLPVIQIFSNFLSIIISVPIGVSVWFIFSIISGVFTMSEVKSLIGLDDNE